MSSLPRETKRVLVVDGSVVARRVFDRLFAAHPGYEVIATVPTVAHAVQILAERTVDFTIIDLEQPGCSGAEALDILLSSANPGQVVVTSSSYGEGSPKAIDALASGASDIISKPANGHFSAAYCDRLISHLATLSQDTAQVRDRGNGNGEAFSVRPVGKDLRAVAIGASTGGIRALQDLLRNWPGPFHMPVFVTQHLPHGFIPYFREQITRMTNMPVVIATDGLPVAPGTIYVAPGDGHLSLERTTRFKVVVRITADRSVHGAFPAVDPMFSAVAAAYGSGTCGIILSGMGRDGTEGCRRIVAENGWIIAQDEQTSTVWGMPGSVVKAGLASVVAKPADMASFFDRRGQVAA